MNICVPFASKKIASLVFGEGRRALNRTLQSLEGKHDAGILSWLTWAVKMRANNGAGKVLVGDGPRQDLCLCIQRRFCFPRSGARVGWDLVGALKIGFKSNGFCASRRDSQSDD